MRSKFGTLLMVLGAALIFGALALFMRNEKEATSAGQAAQDLMPLLIQQIQDAAPEEIPEGTVSLPDIDIPTAYLDEADFEMAEVKINGRMYIGYLSVPKLGLEVPILSKWDYPSLQIAPCRYCGTVKGQDLVLLAHNYPKHFGRLSELSEGDSILFTDMDGDTTSYEVVAKDVLAPTAVEEVTSGVYDLTLFTCTYGGQSRVTVYCDIT